MGTLQGAGKRGTMSGFAGLWGRAPPPPTAKELVKEQKKAVRKSQREIDREMRKMEKEEKKLLADIKKTATAGNTGAAKHLAKQLVQTRNAMGKLRGTSSQLGSIGMKASSMQTNHIMVDAMKSSTNVMAAMNKQMNPMETQAMAQKFAVENDKMQIQSDLFDDMFDSMMDEDEEAEGDELVDQVLAEIGLNATSGL